MAVRERRGSALSGLCTGLALLTGVRAASTASAGGVQVEASGKASLPLVAAGWEANRAASVHRGAGQPLADPTLGRDSNGMWMVAAAHGAVRATERGMVARLRAGENDAAGGEGRVWSAAAMWGRLSAGQPAVRSSFPLQAPTPGALGLFAAAAALCVLPRRSRR